VHIEVQVNGGRLGDHVDVDGILELEVVSLEGSLRRLNSNLTTSKSNQHHVLTKDHDIECEDNKGNPLQEEK